MKFSTDKILTWSKNYSNWLPVIQWTGWIIIVSMLAKLFWVVTLHIISPDVSEQTVTLKQNSRPNLNNSRKTTDVSALINRHLFGSTEVAVVEEKPQEVEVQETKLNLKLRGIYSADIVDHSNSIIEDGQGKQNVYFIGDKLKVSGRVFLRHVYADKVILENNGRNEELRLLDPLPDSMRSKSKRLPVRKKAAKRTDDKRKNRQISQSLNKYREQLLDDPLSLVGLVNFQPKLVNGEMIGFAISPGKDKRLFTQLGLRSRDIVTSINGVSLSNSQDAFQLLSEVQNMQELDVEIKRGNETISLLLNLNNKLGI